MLKAEAFTQAGADAIVTGMNEIAWYLDFLKK
jgi:hypothetical protein